MLRTADVQLPLAFPRNLKRFRWNYTELLVRLHGRFFLAFITKHFAFDVDCVGMVIAVLKETE